MIPQGKSRPPGLLRRVLWWVWVVLLTVLLVLGFVFEAPWKATTLIGIFLTAATILPRAYRKWFWACVGVVVLAIIAWILLPEDNKGWRPYTFDKELAQLQAKYAVPDSENAAVIYNQILENWKQKEPNEPNLPECWFDLVKYVPWFSKDQPEIASYIRYHQDTIEHVIQASKFEQCSFPIASDPIKLDDTVKRFGAMRQWAYLLVAAGNSDLAEGNTKEAIEKHLALLRMGQHLSRQPSSLDMMVGIAVEALGLRCINSFVVSGDANEFYLNKLEQAVSEIRHDFNSDLPGFIDTDKLMFKNVCGWMFYQTNKKGQVRLGCDPSVIIKELNQKQSDNKTSDVPEFFSSYWFKKLTKVYAIPYWFYAPQTPEKLSRIVDKSFEKHYLMTKPDFDWPKEPPEVPMKSFFQRKINFQQQADLLAQMNYKVYSGLQDIYLRQSAQQRGTLLIIALRRYKNTNGHWPEKLDDINNLVSAETFVDPINSGSFVYKLTDDNFTLYSKGENSIDESGEFKSSWPPPPGQHSEAPSPDDRMIWPIGKAKTQQEKANEEQ